MWVMLLSLTLSAGFVRAGEPEYKVKAAFLVNIAKFVSWNEGVFANEDRFALCLIGRDPFGDALNGIENKQIAGKHIILQQLISGFDHIGECRLAFISKSEQGNLEKILKASVGKPVVTVSDIEGFASSGGIFEFKDKDGRLSFVINNTRAKANGIHISASLLALAIEVL